MAKIVPLPPPKTRVSPRLRHAIELHVTEGLTITEACLRAGFTRQSWARAMKRGPVRDLLEQVQRRFVASADANRARYRAVALDQAMNLLLSTKSEAIKARMIEFLASDAKVSPVAVHIDARQPEGPKGYIYQRPAGLVEGEA